MADHDAHPGLSRHLIGLAVAAALAAGCWWFWDAAGRVAEFLGVPELRILTAFAGVIALLTLAQLAGERPKT